MNQPIEIKRRFLWSIVYRLIVPGNPIATHITKTGFLVSAVIAGIGIAAYAANNNLLFLIFSVLLSSLFLSLFLSLLHFRNIQWKFEIPTQPRAKEKTYLHLLVSNKNILFPVYSLSFEVLVNQQRQTYHTKLQEIILPGQQARVPIMLILPDRGHNRIEVLCVSSQFPFGFVNRRKEGKTVIKALAWTAQVSSEISLPSNSLHAENDHLPAQIRGSQEYSHVRKYVAGDQLKNIHWKASARTKNLLTKEFHHPNDQKLSITVSIQHPISSSTFETLCITFRQLAFLAKQKNLLQQVTFADQCIDVDQHHRSWVEFENCLACWEHQTVSEKKAKSVRLVMKSQQDQLLLTTESN